MMLQNAGLHVKGWFPAFSDEDFLGPAEFLPSHDASAGRARDSRRDGGYCGKPHNIFMGIERAKALFWKC